jgi:membrane protein
MNKKLQGIGKIIKSTFKGWNEDDPFRQSAVIAYYAIFSLPALLVLIINVVGLFFEKDVVNAEISRQISGVMGDDTAEQVEKIVAKAGEMKAGVISTIIAIFTIIFGATGVFMQLQKTLNQIWDVRQKPNKGFLKEMKSRLFSFGLVISIGFLLLMSLVISSMLAAMSNWLEGYFPEGIAYLFYVLEFAVSFSVITVLFALMFKFLPDVHLPWRNVWVGSAITAALFIIGKYALSFYFGKAEPGSVYGVAGSVILILLWTSYSSMIVFLGAEFTKQYAVYHGIKIEPTEDAEIIDDCENPNNPAGKKEEDSDSRSGQKAVNKGDRQRTNKNEYSKNNNMKKIKSQKDLEDEIASLETKLSVEKELIKEKLRPAKVVTDILQKRKTIPRPDNQELIMEGMEFGIHLLTGVVMKKTPENIRSLTNYALTEFAKNYVYGESDPWVDHIKSFLNIKTNSTARRKNEGLGDEHFYDVVG